MISKIRKQIEDIYNKKVTFFVGAGMSLESGGISSSALSKKIKKYIFENFSDERIEMFQKILEKSKRLNDLSKISDFVKIFFGKDELINAVDFNSRDDWESVDELIKTHRNDKVTKKYKILGMLVKEKFIDEVFTTNYDNLIEAGCHNIGIKEFTKKEESKDEKVYRIISKKKDYYNFYPQENIFNIYKIHGSSHDFRYKNEKDYKDHLESIILTSKELQGWRFDNWSKELLHDRLRTNHFIFIGFSLQDENINNSVSYIIEDIVKYNKNKRIDVVDLKLSFEILYLLLNFKPEYVNIEKYLKTIEDNFFKIEEAFSLDLYFEYFYFYFILKRINYELFHDDKLLWILSAKKRFITKDQNIIFNNVKTYLEKIYNKRSSIDEYVEFFLYKLPILRKNSVVYGGYFQIKNIIKHNLINNHNYIPHYGYENVTYSLLIIWIQKVLIYKELELSNDGNYFLYDNIMIFPIVSEQSTDLILRRLYIFLKVSIFYKKRDAFKFLDKISIVILRENRKKNRLINSTLILKIKKILKMKNISLIETSFSTFIKRDVKSIIDEL